MDRIKRMIFESRLYAVAQPQMFQTEATADI